MGRCYGPGTSRSGPETATIWLTHARARDTIPAFACHSQWHSTCVPAEVLIRANEARDDVLIGLAVVDELVHPVGDFIGAGGPAEILLVVRLYVLLLTL